MAEPLPIDQQRIQGVPSPAEDRSDTVGEVSAQTLARGVRDFHRQGLHARRHRDLTAEKYALHLDGEGDSQWADLHHGSRIFMPSPLFGAPRQQNNQLRPITDNMVAHLTTRRFTFLAESKPSREAREKALIDAAIINHFARKQRWNQLWAEAKYIAAAFGSCPVHAMWREDSLDDGYEAVWAQDEFGNPMIGVKPGTIDSWVGNPWGTVYDTGATRTRLHRATYERVLPAELVRNAFGRAELEGTTRLPSASVFHRISAKWSNFGGGVHGRADIQAVGDLANQELISLLFDELAPGIDPQFPQGRLCIVALQGAAGAERDFGLGSAAGRPELLWCGGLPAESFSFVRVFSHHGRMDDPLGKPFIADLDDDQIALNQAETLHTEYLRRASKAPLATSGGINVDTLDLTGDTLIEVEPLTAGSVELQWLEQPSRHIPALESKIIRILEGMYRKGGWQSASRGELPSGTSGKAIVSAQAADDSIFGPLTAQTQMELQDYARLTWKLFRSFADIPHVIDLAGDDLAHIADASVDRTMLSDDAPQFVLTSGFGVTPEADAQQLLELMGAVDYMGEGLVTAKMVRELWPDRRLFGANQEDPQRVRERRPRVVNALLREIASAYLEQYGDRIQDRMGDPKVLQLGQLVALEVDQEEPALPDDDMMAHIDALSLITQDTSEHSVTRTAAMQRQQQYFMVIAAQQAAAQAAAQGAPGEEGAEEGGEEQEGGGEEESAQVGSDEGGTVNANSMVEADRRAAKQARQQNG